MGFQAQPAPLGQRGRATGSMDPKLDLDLDISDLGFDQISSHKRGGCPTGPAWLAQLAGKNPRYNPLRNLSIVGPKGHEGGNREIPPS